MIQELRQAFHPGLNAPPSSFRGKPKRPQNVIEETSEGGNVTKRPSAGVGISKRTARKRSFCAGVLRSLSEKKIPPGTSASSIVQGARRESPSCRRERGINRCIEQLSDTPTGCLELRPPNRASVLSS